MFAGDSLIGEKGNTKCSPPYFLLILCILLLNKSVFNYSYSPLYCSKVKPVQLSIFYGNKIIWSCLYKESLWGPKHWNPLTFTVWKKENKNKDIFVFSKRERKGRLFHAFCCIFDSQIFGACTFFEMFNAYGFIKSLNESSGKTLFMVDLKPLLCSLGKAQQGFITDLSTNFALDYISLSVLAYSFLPQHNPFVVFVSAQPGSERQMFLLFIYHNYISKHCWKVSDVAQGCFPYPFWNERQNPSI